MGLSAIALNSISVILWGTRHSKTGIFEDPCDRNPLPHSRECDLQKQPRINLKKLTQSLNLILTQLSLTGNHISSNLLRTKDFNQI
jgi:hypothetical protein